MKMESKSLSEIILEQAIDKDILFYDKISFFERELELIVDPIIRRFVEFILAKAEPFWASPASQIPHAHPEDEYSQNGLAVHTKRVVKILSITVPSVKLTEREADCLYTAGFLHDITKAVWKDKDQKEVFHDEFHAYTVEGFIRWCQYASESDLSQQNLPDLDPEILDLVLRLIRCSHGIWSLVPETVPASQLENLLHNADMIAAHLHYIAETDTSIDVE